MTRQTVYTRQRTADEEQLVRRVAATIRVIAAARGMSLADVERATGLSHEVVVYVAGGIREPTLVEVHRIAQAMGSTVLEVVTADPERLAADNGVNRSVLEGRGYGW